MVARRPAQTNVRSDIVARRVREVAARTGLKATQFIEEAVQLHQPLGQDERCGRLIRDGEYWMMPAKNLPPLGLEQINEAIEATRLRGDIED